MKLKKILVFDSSHGYYQLVSRTVGEGIKVDKYQSKVKSETFSIDNYDLILFILNEYGELFDLIKIFGLRKCDNIVVGSPNKVLHKKLDELEDLIVIDLNQIKSLFFDKIYYYTSIFSNRRRNVS